MKALVLLSSLALGGAERVTVSFLRRLGNRGSPAALCTVSSRRDPALASELDGNVLAYYDLGARRLADPRALLRYLRLLRRESFDVVHAHGQDAGILAAAGRLFAPTPYVLTRHVLDEPERDSRQRLRARGSLIAARRARALLAVSGAAADHLSAIADIPRTAIQVVPNGVEIERFDRDELRKRRCELRERFGLAAEDSMVLVAAALRDGKGHEVLIDALPLLRRRVPAARVVVAGAGEQEERLRGLAAPHGDAILFLGSRDDVPELIAASDLVVLPSFSEGLPTVLMEAAAAGRPVVATRVGGVPEVVDDGHTGLLVPPGDPSALAAAMTALLLDPNRARSLGEAARRRARRHFSLDAQVERTLMLWSEAVRAAR